MLLYLWKNTLTIPFFLGCLHYRIWGLDVLACVEDTIKPQSYLHEAHLTEGTENTCEAQGVEKLQTKTPFLIIAMTQSSRENGSHALPGLDCTPGTPGGIHSFEEVREERSRWRIGKVEDEDESGEE